MRQIAVVIAVALTMLFWSGCAATLTHVPSRELQNVKAASPAKVVVADVGDARGEAPNAIGFGVSYWVPQSFSARDSAGGSLPVSFFIADCVSRDLNQVGFVSSLANKERRPMSADEAIAAGKAAGADYVVTTKVIHGKTNFWGFLVIPLFEPVWTRIGLEVGVIDVKSAKPKAAFSTYRKRTEWNFAKVALLDAVFDAAIFGRWWHRKAWGQTVVPDALAEVVQRIVTEIGK